MKMVTVNMTLLRKVHSNNRKCLCNLSLDCPCKEFLYKNKCKCGTYITQDTMTDKLYELLEDG